ncbi:MAG: bifunctional DNA-formamidopyrimidine glycosylase/DNA-(apurinic or apyrimidinic site) lyase [Magnetococcales bacterium]|nr:bifunctional DNA-formamidopyrimidine glycosylase/DNA-(apurinic or apyrimidinic site) lyase [Magnetococcales bacterium]
MPELPEVETVRRGLWPLLQGRRVERVSVRQSRLRWPVDEAALAAVAAGAACLGLTRRGKYLLWQLSSGWVICHLGMTGCLRVVSRDEAWEKHAHLAFLLDNQEELRFSDTRRFGAVIAVKGNPLEHPLLAALGPEPWDPLLTPSRLAQGSRGRRVPVHAFLQDAKVVAGVGNIYASEILFRVGLSPVREVGEIAEWDALLTALRRVLEEAVAQGGSTVRDFRSSDGRPGYFQQYLNVYGREGLPCPTCQTPVQRVAVRGRSAFWCPRCQG